MAADTVINPSSIFPRTFVGGLLRVFHEVHLNLKLMVDVVVLGALGRVCKRGAARSPWQ
jgi:hypothetical protein